MDDYQIVPISEEHIEGFHAAVDFVSKEKKYLAFLEGPSLEESREFVMGNIADDVPQFVVISEGRVVGWCDIIPVTHRLVYLHVGVLGVGLLPEFRGKGIGAHLINTTIEAAKARGLSRIELTVRETNMRAARLYERLGFEVEGTKKKAIYFDGRYEDLVMMALVV